MERNLDEVIVSQRRMLENQGMDGATLSDTKLRRLFSRQLRQVKGLLNAHAIPWLGIAYQEAVEDPATTARKVSEFLGGTCDEQAMIDAVSPALYRQRAAAN